MTIDEFNIKNGNVQRYGFTTGTSATAAAMGALYLYLKSEKKMVEVELPAGISLSIPIEYSKVEDDYYICGVIKDAGDDPDVTDGILISAKLEFIKKNDGLEFNFFVGRRCRNIHKERTGSSKG